MTRSLRPNALAFATLLALASAAPANAQGDAAPTGSASVAALDVVAEGSGEALAAPTFIDVRVVVVTAAEAGDGDPVADAPVRLHVITPPHEVLETIEASADDAGVATFRVLDRPNIELVAEANTGRRFFSDTTAVRRDAPVELRVEAFPTSHDPSVVKATSVHTIVELWEGYITVTQAWNLDVTEPVIYTAERDETGRPNLATLLRIPLPAEAEGVNILRPEGTARVSGSAISASLEIGPRSMDERRGADVLVQYSIPSDSRSEVAWEQLLQMDVDAFNVVVPQESEHTRHPVLDVQVAATGCDDPSAVCLAPNDRDAAGLPMADDIDVVLVSGAAQAGQTVHVVTSGWPHASRWQPRAAAVGAALAAVFAIALFVTDRRRGRGSADEQLRAGLESQRAALLDAAARIDAQLDDGLIIEADHSVAMERVRQQLGVVYRRMRELDAASSAESPKA